MVKLISDFNFTFDYNFKVKFTIPPSILKCRKNYKNAFIKKNHDSISYFHRNGGAVHFSISSSSPIRESAFR